MKKHLLLIIFLLAAGSLAAQKETDQKPQKWYIRIALGGGVSTSSSFDLLYDYDNSGGSKSVSVHPVGIGNGFCAAVGFGYWFSKYVGVEVAVNHFLGLPVEGDSVVHLMGATQANVKVAGSLLSVIPSVVISAGLDKINPYARFGLLVGVWPRITTQYTQENSTVNPPTSLTINNQYYGGLSLGYQAAGGVTFSMSKLISLFAELQFSHSTWSPSYSEITKYDVNGEDKLSTLLPYQKQVNFVDKKYITGTVDMSQPKEELRKTIPFSTAAIMFGIKFKL
jgi:long-subunit fatty acid transport protein